ncbi:uncharacterized protein ARMOST_18230 [Armillaria ostoyae]|uniref:Uncharacterized protein n=1 Tax=Armillaria ostoyae TaxID=47428 RepID=A0A284S168_ARMOS|nr:uncharacterized protein ARMOST_18230 [Armillaria ostoyae]
MDTFYLQYRHPNNDEPNDDEDDLIRHNLKSGCRSFTQFCVCQQFELLKREVLCGNRLVTTMCSVLSHGPIILAVLLSKRSPIFAPL